MQLDLLPAPPAYSRGTAAGAARTSDTSVAAAASVAPSLAARQSAVLEVIRRQGGATCAEVAQALGLAMHAVSGRITELRLQGRLRDSGARRAGPSGRLGAVWVEVRT
jgi:predicted ArsR family transcriptional regulator